MRSADQRPGRLRFSFVCRLVWNWNLSFKLCVTVSAGSRVVRLRRLPSARARRSQQADLDTRRVFRVCGAAGQGAGRLPGPGPAQPAELPSYAELVAFPAHTFGWPSLGGAQPGRSTGFPSGR